MAGRSSDSWRHDLPPSDDWRGGGDGGGFWQRMFAGFTSTNFLDWAFPLYTFKGIRVRVHVLYLVIAAVELVQAGSANVGWAAFNLAALFVLVLLHEYGHCIACRVVRGEADDILMWPLGGLASCRPPKQWKAELITVLAGPAVNLVLALLLAPVILAVGGKVGALVWNPFAGGPSLIGLHDASWKFAIWWVYLLNVVLFLFNMLIPMFPMDAGRVLQCVLWIKLGWRRSMSIAASVGIVTALLLGVYGLYTQATRLMMIAVLGGQMCYHQRQRMKFLEHSGEPEEEESPFAESLAWREGQERTDRAFQEAAKRQQRELAEARKLQMEEDRILAKIASQGMQSLSRSERKTLEEATRRRRG